jgi:hypothetical protein
MSDTQGEPQEVVDLDDGRFGVTDGTPQPVPNRVDAAFAELQALREEARALGLDVDDSEPLDSLRGRVEAARASQ